MIKLHLGLVKSELDPSKDMALFPHSYFNQDFLKLPLSSYKINFPRLFENFHDRESIYKQCEALACSYVTEHKKNYEKKNSIHYPEIFYTLILLPYYTTIINYTYARYLYIKKYMEINNGKNFYVETFEIDLPRRLETKKEFSMNLFPNIDFIEWFSSIILEKLNFNNLIIKRTKGKVILFEISLIETDFWKDFKRFLRKKENIIRFYRIILFLNASFVNFIPYRIRSFRNIYGIGPIRSLIYSIILNLKAFISKKTQNEDYNNYLESPKHAFPDDLIVILDDLIKKTLPRSIDDLFSHYVAKIEKENTFIPGKIRFDSTGFANDHKSFLQALAVSKGEKLVFTQHGSHYCTIENSWCPDSYEYYGNYFINWGNVKPKNKSCKFVSMPSPHLSRLWNKHKFVNESVILVGTCQRQTNDGICAIDPTYYLDYILSKEIFINKLNKDILPNFCYRPWPQLDTIYFSDEKYMKDIFPDLNILKGDLIKAILRTKVLVIDHYGTAFYEAMAANTPVIIYFAYPELKFTKYAEEMFQELKDVGIYYDNAESAAQAVNKVWYNIEEWWFSEKLQKVRNKFIYLFALTDKNWSWQWTKFILKFESASGRIMNELKHKK